MFDVFYILLETFRSGIVDLFFGVFLHLYSLWTWGVISKKPNMKSNGHNNSFINSYVHNIYI